MIVVADTSPFVVLVQIAHIDVLPRLFGEVFVPPQVTAELRAAQRAKAVRDFIDAPPSWLHERAPSSIENMPALHAGELAAISLARELRADLLLVDESCARRAALSRGIPIAGTIGVLELAANRGLLELADAFEAVKQTDFWISPRLLDERLRAHLAHRKTRL